MEFVLEEFHRNTPNEELIEDVKRVAALCQKESLTGKEYEAQGRFSLGTLRNRFGSWNEVLRRAGLSVERGRFKNHCYCEKDEDFFEDLGRIAKQLKRDYVSIEEYEKYGKYSHGQRLKRFKRWDNLLKAAGLEPTPFRSGPNLKYSDEELFEEIERLWISLGRQPRCEEVNSRTTYTRRFGSWRNALQAFVEYINSDTSEEKSKVTSDDIETLTQSKEEQSIKHKTTREVNLRLRFKTMARDCFKCCKCGKSPATDPSVILHIDHIIPWSKGGETIMENLQTLCSECNLGKSDLMIK